MVQPLIQTEWMIDQVLLARNGHTSRAVVAEVRADQPGARCGAERRTLADPSRDAALDSIHAIASAAMLTPATVEDTAR